MKYFFDNNISPRYARMLDALGVEATPLCAVFPRNIQDVDFLEQLKTHNFDVYVSGDTNQRRNIHERKALKSTGLISIYFMPFWNNLPFWNQAIWLVKNWERIDGFCQGCAKGTCADIQQNARSHIFHLD